jgi:hypothetical protein
MFGVSSSIRCTVVTISNFYFHIGAEFLIYLILISLRMFGFFMQKAEGISKTVSCVVCFQLIEFYIV